MSNNAIWSEIKERFRNASSGKCWYCESTVIREHGAIDHFRPKSSVAGTSHPGYWWLAYDWKNYRFSCTYCNSPKINPETHELSGKRDLFPLIDENQRAKDPTYPTEQEQPVLLDPTEPEDPLLLWFAEDGSVMPAIADKHNYRAFRRAKESIVAYHLNHPFIREQRKAVFDCIQQYIDLVEELIDYHNAIKDENFRQKLATRIHTLGKIVNDYINVQAEYSAAALAYLETSLTYELSQYIHISREGHD